jgi:hypothetical protein
MGLWYSFKYDVLMKDKTRLEDKVDEYLKKMEDEE